jgi:hypothetical protein
MPRDDRFEIGVYKAGLMILKANIVSVCSKILDDPYAPKLKKQIANKALVEVETLTDWPEGLR